MTIAHTLLKISTAESIDIYDITEKIQAFIDSQAIQSGQALIFSRHTTTALAINEYEERLLTDIKTYLR
ncbi:MAG: YjbQ family protein, partial [Cyanobacteria bacterium P01_F01_bin.3]